MEDTAIRLQDLRKSFGATTAVAGVDLEIRDGEFFAMLGPSGSGKTTVLRLIAGFEKPSAGRIELAGQEVTDLAPFERDVHTVFQDYALFPHMTVEQNVAYSLKVRKVPRAERAARARRALAQVRLEGYGGRRPAELSGGQRQRVALARALVGRPRVLLLDEPLGALDLKLRQEMQAELKALQREIGITFVFVTHDQEEALTMSDRIAVFHDGRVEQVGTPAEIYECPATPFVASFVGTTNLLEGERARRVLGAFGTYSIRPERIRVLHESADPAPPGQATVTGTVSDAVYLGDVTRYLVDLDGGGRLTALQQNLETSAADAVASRGSRVRLQWDRRYAFAVPASSPSSGASPSSNSSPAAAPSATASSASSVSSATDAVPDRTADPDPVSSHEDG